MRHQALDPLWNRRRTFDRFPEDRMDERERRRVEGVALDRDRRARTQLSVDRVADNRVTEGCQVHADLMRTARLKAGLQERELGEALEHAIARDRALAAPRRPDRHL